MSVWRKSTSSLLEERLLVLYVNLYWTCYFVNVFWLYLKKRLKVGENYVATSVIVSIGQSDEDRWKMGRVVHTEGLRNTCKVQFRTPQVYLCLYGRIFRNLKQSRVSISTGTIWLRTGLSKWCCEFGKEFFCIAWFLEISYFWVKFKCNGEKPYTLSFQ
jgi:hypothetical protein